jgi:hypothetical protein
VIKENCGRGHAAPTPNELANGQEEEEDSGVLLEYLFSKRNII